MFEKTLSDVVKGIRGTKRDTGLYISQCIAEIKQELKSPDSFTKANALQKLTFLQMMGYGMSWASFACVEVMSSQRFAHKRIGYLAGCQGFTEADTDIILLTTNLLKKELKCASSVGVNGVYEAGLAINFVANVVTEDLARELLPEVTHLTQHPHPYLRKKAVLCLFKLFVKYPQGLRLTFDRIQQCLTDPDAPVASCAVNVITELSDKNPKNYLLMAPQFFQLLTNSSNNWMLIKVVKLLGSLVSEEPRLARKLLEPLSGIVKSTAAKSLLYEAVYTITLALPYCRKADGSMPSAVPEIIQLCSQTLKEFVEDPDQNLKYLGLVGLGSLMQSQPQVLSQTREYKDLILMCLSDEDVTIRSRALELLSGMATRKNLRDLITQLLRHVELADGAYQRELVEKIISICRQDKYALISDFSWYLTQVLVRLARVRPVEDAHGELLKHQMMDVALRVLPVRKVAVKTMASLLLEQMKQQQSQGVSSSSWAGQRSEGVMPAVLPAAAWVVGEYSHLIAELLANSDDVNELKGELTMEQMTMNLPGAAGPYHAIVQSLIWPVWTVELATATQSIYVQSAMKVFASACQPGGHRATDVDLEACVLTLRQSLPLFIESTDSEVQERALSSLQLLETLGLTKGLNAMAGSDASAGLTIAYPVSEATPPATLLPTSKSSDSEDDSSTGTDDSDNDNNNDANSTNNGTGNTSSGDLLGLLGSAAPITSKDEKKAAPEQKKAATTSAGPSSSDPFDITFLQGAVPSNANAAVPLAVATTTGSGSSTAQQCRTMAAVLATMLVPDPMKPVSGKAQRRVAPPMDINLEDPLNESVFSELLTQDNAIGLMRRKQYNTKKAASKSLEAVSFTQQRAITSVAASSGQQMALKNQFGGPVVAIPLRGTHNALDIFENGGGAEFPVTSTRPNDPFYLQSSSTALSGPPGGGAHGSNPSRGPAAASSKFGVIQLGDDDADHDIDDDHHGRRHKKDKKKKKDKKHKKGKGKDGSMNDVDLAMFDFGGGVGRIATTQQPLSAMVTGTPAVYQSDEDDENGEDKGVEEGNLLQMSPVKTKHSGKKKQAKSSSGRGEFAGLAQVDLTTPLGVDEVMPVRTHRQVPTPSAATEDKYTHAQLDDAKRSSSKKDKKKKKKDKKEKDSPANIMNGGGNGADLLDLGMFESIPSVAPSPSTSQRPSATDDFFWSMSAPSPAAASLAQHPANDLFNLAQPTQAIASGAATSGHAAGLDSMVDIADNSTHTRPWMKGTIKADSSKGSEANFDMMALHYKVYVSKGSKHKRGALPSATLSLRLTNHGRISMRDVTVSIAGSADVTFEDVPPGQIVESKAKMGRFTYSDAAGESSHDIKGHATAAGCSRVTIKLTLPCAMLLKPVKSAMTPDQVMSELAQGDWSSHSCKLELSALSSPQDVIGLVSALMKATVIGNNDPTALFLASYAAASDTQVRALVKTKSSSVKVDVKCSNGNALLGKALVSDLKKLVL
jgi:AP-3 complex subunit delta-1